jgi:hypothetical protein
MFDGEIAVPDDRGIAHIDDLQLQPGGEVGRFADDGLLLRRALADQIADDHQPGGDPHPRLELGGFDIEATDSVDGTQPGPDCPLDIVLMRSRVAEIDQNAIAHSQFVEQRLGLFEVSGIETFLEPTEDRGEQRDRLLLPALLSAQAGGRGSSRRNSQDFAFCRRATSMACCMAVSASLNVPAPVSSASPLSR